MDTSAISNYIIYLSKITNICVKIHLTFTVRLCSDRLRLIESCLDHAENKNRSIKYPQYIVHNYSVDAELMELARRLRIYEDDLKRREGAVLQMLTKDALQVIIINYLKLIILI